MPGRTVRPGVDSSWVDSGNVLQRGVVQGPMAFVLECSECSAVFVDLAAAHAHQYSSADGMHGGYDIYTLEEWNTPRPEHLQIRIGPDGVMSLGAAAPTPKTPNLSAACGVWRNYDGQLAHSHCTGTVSLPPPNDTCECPCHAPEGWLKEKFGGG